MTDFDPTTNLIQFAFLGESARNSLRNWPWGWEYYTLYDERWTETETPAWCKDVVYRGKTAPVVTSVWSNVHPKHVTPYTYGSRAAADRVSRSPDCARIAVLRIDTCNGVSSAHLEDVK